MRERLRVGATQSDTEQKIGKPAAKSKAERAPRKTGNTRKSDLKWVERNGIRKTISHF